MSKHSRRISFVLLALFIACAGSAKADPVGDFFKKVGQSVSKAFQPQPTPPHQPKKLARTSRRSTPSTSNVPGPTPIALEQSPQPTQEEKPTRGVLPASLVPAEKAKGDMPYAIPVPGRKGIVTSPYAPEGNYVDVSAFAPGSAVKDPYTGKIFLVP
ncbi:MAG TPA: hypothetical protein VH229_04610 [Candidatus Udaeobacter sp.]|nr:hypothetical protein [Candidatus Udaeobacter sp.]